jgi:hypothetical protein
LDHLFCEAVDVKNHIASRKPGQFCIEMVNRMHDEARVPAPQRQTLLTGVAIAIVIVTGSACATAGRSRNRAVTLADLTVPAKLLPPRCVMPSRPSVTTPGRPSIGGLWAGLPVPTNPWIGRDPGLIAALRARVEPPLLPDGPPLSRSQEVRYRLKLAEGVEAGYAAFYADADTSIVAVYGVEFAVGEAPTRQPPSWAPASGQTRLDLGRLAVWIVGTDTPCSRAVGGYVQSLARQ